LVLDQIEEEGRGEQGNIYEDSIFEISSIQNQNPLKIFEEGDYFHYFKSTEL